MESGTKGPPLRLEHLPAYLEDKLEHEQAVLDLLVVGQARGQATPELWDKLHAAAMRDDRAAELAFAYERLHQDRRVKIMPPAQQAQIFLYAARFYTRGMGDIDGAEAALDRVLQLVPGHPEAFAQLALILEDKGDREKLVSLHLAAVNPKTERADALEHLRAALDLIPEEDADRALKVAQQLLRLDPGDAGALAALEHRLGVAGKYGDLAKLLEHALSADPGPEPERRHEMRVKLLWLYDDRVPEIERAIPHVEEVLAVDPTHEGARRVATRLLTHRAMGSRAAAALEKVHEAEGDQAGVARMLGIQIEQLRGPKKAEAQKRLGLMLHELGDEPAAFTNLEAAMAVDPNDDQTREIYVKLARSLGKHADATKLLSRAASAVKDPIVRARINLEAGRFTAELGDHKRARVILQTVLDLAEDAVALEAARTLRGILEAQGEAKSQAPILEAIAKLSSDPEEKLDVLRKLSGLYEGELKDLGLAIQARKRVLELDPTAEPEELERLLEARGDFGTLAEVLEIRAGSMPIDDARREMLMRAAELHAEQANDPAAAAKILLRVVGEHGPDREIHARLIPELERSGMLEELAQVLLAELELAEHEARVEILTKLGATFRALGREKDALAASAEVLDSIPDEPHARALALELLDKGEPEVRLGAASVLVPIYRSEDDAAALIRALEVTADLDTDPVARLDALAEAYSHVEALGKDRIRALFLAGRGLREAVIHDVDNVPDWLDRIGGLAEKGPSKAAIAETFASALREMKVIEHPAIARLAQRTGEAYVASGDATKAIEAFRRVLELEPDNEEVLERIDLLLAEKGSPTERIALYRSSLERPGSDSRRQTLWLSIGKVQSEDLADPGAATETYRTGLAELGDSTPLRAALLTALEAADRTDELYKELVYDRERLVAGSIDAAEIEVRLARLATKNGDATGAAGHYRIALATESLELDGVALDPVEAAASAVKDIALLCQVAERRARLAAETPESAAALEHWGELLGESALDASGAARRFFEAGEAAHANGDAERAIRDFERAATYDPSARDALQRLADVHREGGDGVRLLKVTKRLLASATDRASAVALVDGVVDLAQSGKIDAIEALAADVADRFGGAGLDLARVRAEALARAGRAVEAAEALGQLLDGGNAPDADAAASVLDAFLEARGQDPALEPQRRALFEFRIGRAIGDEKTPLLLSLARFERMVGAAGEGAEKNARTKSALDRILGDEPHHADALAMRLDIALEDGDDEGAVACLRARLEGEADDEGRTAVRLDLAEMLANRLNRPVDALEAATPVLDVAPREPRLLALALRTLVVPESAAQAAELLERIAEGSEDVAERAQVYEAIFDSPAATALGEARPRLFEAWLASVSEDPEKALVVAARAAREEPSVDEFWDRTEELARSTNQPAIAAEAYRAVLAVAKTLDPEVAERVGDRGVAFQAEFFDDPPTVTRMLRLVVDAVPTAAWAFERLKLIYNAGERWEELFELYDHVVLAQTDELERAMVLEDAAEVARDLAASPERAMRYLEALRAIRKNDARLESQLERLYERHGEPKRLIELLEARLDRLPADEVSATRLRIAALWFEGSSDLANALDAVRPLLAAENAEAVAMAEMWLATTTPHFDAAQPSWRRWSAHLPGERNEVRTQIALAMIPHFEASSEPASLARMLEVVIEGDLDVALRRRELARLYDVFAEETLDLPAALQAALALLFLSSSEKDEAEAIAKAEAVVKNDKPRTTRLVDALAEIGEAERESDRALRLLRKASELARGVLADESRAIGFDLAILSRSDQDPAAARAAALKLDQTLKAAGRQAERCQVLERLAALAEGPAERRPILVEAASIAEQILDDRARAVASLEKALADFPNDVELLTSMVGNLRFTGDSRALVRTLETRAEATKDEEEAANDRLEVARLYAKVLADPEHAVTAYERVLSLSGPSDEVADELGETLEAMGRDDELAVLLLGESERRKEASARCEMFAWLGETQRRRGSPRDALSAFTSSLHVDPSHSRSLAGLAALVASLSPDDPKERPLFASAVRALASTFQRTNASERWLEMVPSLVAAADNDDERCDLLLRAAETEEKAMNDGGGALARTVQAFAISPAYANVAAAMLRRVEATGLWAEVAPRLLPTLAVEDRIEALIARNLLVGAADWASGAAGVNADVSPGLAEALLSAAYRRSPLDAHVTEKLVAARSATRGRPLVDALVALATARDGDLAALREAATVAARELGDDALALTVTERLFDAASTKLRGRNGREAEPDAVEAALWALDLSTSLLESLGRPGDIKNRLLLAADLPVGTATIAGLRKQAAERAEPAEAAAILELVYEADRNDEEVAQRLVALYEELGQREALAETYVRMAEASNSPGERARLRLVHGEIAIEIGRTDLALASLKKNLEEIPGHDDTFARLARLYEQSGEHAPLVQLLEAQGALRLADDPATAGAIYTRAAKFAENELRDLARAARSFHRVVEVEPSAENLDRYARLLEGAGKHQEEASVLERLASTIGGADAELALRQATAYARAGYTERAREGLERAVEAGTADERVRGVLAELYEANSLFEPLAVLRVREAELAEDDTAKIELLRAAARLWLEELANPEGAVPILERAVEIRPDDLGSLAALADALGKAGRREEAKATLEKVLAEFGTRKPKERALVHFELGKLSLSLGDRAGALKELETATKIDPAHAGVLMALAQIAVEEGQLLRAQRTYRALLMVVRSHRDKEKATAAEATCKSQVLIELAYVSEKQGETDRRTEFVESAFEAARDDLDEWTALVATLKRRKMGELVARALEERLASDVLPKETRTALELDLADLYVAQPARKDDGVDLALSALGRDPSNAKVYARVLALTKTHDAIGKLVTTLRALAEKTEAPVQRADLFDRTAKLASTELGDDLVAADAFEATLDALDAAGTTESSRRAQILVALDPITERLMALGKGSMARHAGVLSRLVDLATDEGAGFGVVAPPLYRLVGVHLAHLTPHAVTGQTGSGDETTAVELLERAVREDTDAERVERELRQAIERATESVRLVRLLEDFSRQQGRTRAIVDALEMLADKDDGDPSIPLRDAYETSLALEDTALSERLLRRIVPETKLGDDPSLLWALSALADLRFAAGDARGAAMLWERAARVSDPDEERATLLRVGDLAKRVLADLPWAAAIFEELRSHEPADREAWAPLSEVYRELGDTAKLADLMDQTIPLVDEPRERADLRLTLARMLQQIEPERAADVLAEAALEDPENKDVAIVLMELYAAIGADEKLIDLLDRQLDVAKDAEDRARVVLLGLRLAELRERTGDAESALDTYHGVLDWDEKNLVALRAVVRLMMTREDSLALGDMLDRLLEIETGDEAVALALRVADLKESTGDAEAAEHALVAGFRASPTSLDLKARLSKLYEQQNDRLGLARLAAIEAGAVVDPMTRKDLLIKAAEIIREHGDAREATDLYALALAADPGDRDLLFSFMDQCANTSQHGRAIEAVDRAFDGTTEPEDAPWLYFSRAVLREAVGESDAALDDLERAFDKSGGQYATELRSHLEAALGRVERDPTASRRTVLEISLRLAEVAAAGGDVDSAREVALDILRRDPQVAPAWRSLARIEERAGNWPAAAQAWEQLAGLSQGEDLALVAIRLFDASRNAGAPDLARASLERALETFPGDARLKSALRTNYEESGAVPELSEMIIADARLTEEPTAKYELFLEAARLLLYGTGEASMGPAMAERALVVLEEARSVVPEALDALLLTAEAFGASGRPEEAREILVSVVGAQKGKRSKELGQAFYAMYRVESRDGNLSEALEVLVKAFDNQPQNGGIALELGQLAIDLDEKEIALRAFRAVTLMRPDASGGISSQDRAIAYFHLGNIAVAQGDPRRAKLMLDKALAEDATLEAARDLLARL